MMPGLKCTFTTATVTLGSFVIPLQCFGADPGLCTHQESGPLSSREIDGEYIPLPFSKEEKLNLVKNKEACLRSQGGPA